MKVLIRENCSQLSKQAPQKCPRGIKDGVDGTIMTKHTHTRAHTHKMASDKEAQDQTILTFTAI